MTTIMGKFEVGLKDKGTAVESGFYPALSALVVCGALFLYSWQSAGVFLAF